MVVLVAVVSSSCATAKFDPKKPATSMGGRGLFIQDGERVSEQEVRDFLKTQPETEYKAKQSEIWQWVAVVPAAVGGFFIGYYAFDDNRASNTNLWVGLALVGAAGVAGAHSDRLLTEAVDRHNQKLVSTKKSANEFTFHPLLATQPETDVPSAGLGFTFSLN